MPERGEERVKFRGDFGFRDVLYVGGLLVGFAVAWARVEARLDRQEELLREIAQIKLNLQETQLDVARLKAIIDFRVEDRGVKP